MRAPFVKDPTLALEEGMRPGSGRPASLTLSARSLCPISNCFSQLPPQWAPHHPFSLVGDDPAPSFLFLAPVLRTWRGGWPPCAGSNPASSLLPLPSKEQHLFFFLFLNLPVTTYQYFNGCIVWFYYRPEHAAGPRL